MTDTDLIEQSFAIAWSVLEKSGELRDPNWSANFLLDEIIGNAQVRRTAQARSFELRNRCVPTSTSQTRLMIDPDCEVCLGIGWVCENHPHRAWTDELGLSVRSRNAL